MKIPKHKRFLYRLTGHTDPAVGVIQKTAIWASIYKCLRYYEIAKYETDEKAFEATFRHGSEFIKWIDEDWQGEEG